MRLYLPGRRLVRRNRPSSPDITVAKVSHLPEGAMPTRAWEIGWPVTASITVPLIWNDLLAAGCCCAAKRTAKMTQRKIRGSMNPSFSSVDQVQNYAGMFTGANPDAGCPGKIPGQRFRVGIIKSVDIIKSKNLVGARAQGSSREGASSKRRLHLRLCRDGIGKNHNQAQLSLLFRSHLNS